MGRWSRIGQRRRSWEHLAAGLLVAASLLLRIGAAHAQGSLCDPSLPSPATDPLGYRQRGDRCEGRYIKDVGNTTLTFGSLVESFAPVDRASARPLYVVWPVPPGAQEVHLRAQGLKRRLYYRMDTERPAASGSYTWPSTLLVAVAPGAGDIGLLASTRLYVGGTLREVHLPLRVGYAQHPPSADRYELVVVPGVQLSELFYTLNELDTDGRLRHSIRQNVALEYGYYPAERAIGITIPSALLRASGFYQVQLVARLESGGVAMAELWLYHRGR